MDCLSESFAILKLSKDLGLLTLREIVSLNCVPFRREIRKVLAKNLVIDSILVEIVNPFKVKLALFVYLPQAKEGFRTRSTSEKTANPKRVFALWNPMILVDLTTTISSFKNEHFMEVGSSCSCFDLDHRNNMKDGIDLNSI